MNEKELEKIFKAVANRRRILILKYLKQKGAATVGDIAEEIKLSFRSTSRHLSVLYSAELLDKRQASLNIFYFILKSRKELINKLLSL